MNMNVLAKAHISMFKKSFIIMPALTSASIVRNRTINAVFQVMLKKYLKT